jgi:hypothetical protein
MAARHSEQVGGNQHSGVTAIIKNEGATLDNIAARSSADAEMVDENRRFVDEYANPHSWLQAAKQLHEQAVDLYARRGKSSILTRVDPKGMILDQQVQVDKSVFLLGGFAIENALKAFLVYENPAWISNGKLARPLRTHGLVALQRGSKFVPYKRRYTKVLKAFESGLDSHFRYPCALSIDETKQEYKLYDALWSEYLKVMRSYGRRLSDLFEKGWRGPHGAYGRWYMEGDVLGFSKPFNSGTRWTRQQGNGNNQE